MEGYRLYHKELPFQCLPRGLTLTSSQGVLPWSPFILFLSVPSKKRQRIPRLPLTLSFPCVLRLWHFFPALFKFYFFFNLQTLKNTEWGTSLVVQWWRLHAPNAGGLGLIPGQGTGSREPQLKILRAATKTRHSQINKQINKYFLKKYRMSQDMCSDNFRKLNELICVF